MPDNAETESTRRVGVVPNNFAYVKDRAANRLELPAASMVLADMIPSR